MPAIFTSRMPHAWLSATRNHRTAITCLSELSGCYFVSNVRLIPARLYRDDALLARRHIGVLSIGDGVAHSYFQDVCARCDFYFLRPVGDFFGLAGLHAVDEYNGTHGRTGDNQLGRIGCVGLAMKPATARDAKQQDNKECFQWSTLAQRKRRAYHGAQFWDSNNGVTARIASNVGLKFRPSETITRYGTWGVLRTD